MVTVAPASTPVHVAVKAVPSLAGLGSTVQIAAVGAVLSKVKNASASLLLPDKSVMVATSLPSTLSIPAVAVQTTSLANSFPQA